MTTDTGYAIVSPSYRVTTETDFNRLVFEAILFEEPEEAQEILKRMFPDKDVHIECSENGNGFLTVGDVGMRFRP